MKLIEYKSSTNIKALLCGPPGTGKTCFAASLPYPILYLDFDGKVNSAARWFDNDPARLEAIDVRKLTAMLGDQDPVADMNKIISTELIPQQKAGKMNYKTLVIDSLTTYSQAVLSHIVRTNPGIKRNSSSQGVQPGLQDYGILKREFCKLIQGILSLDMNIIMCAHIKTDRSDLTGEIIRSPLMDGSFGQELPVYFEEVWRTFMKDGKPYAQTQSDNYFNFCRSQIKGLPNPVELNYEKIKEKL